MRMSTNFLMPIGKDCFQIINFPKFDGMRKLAATIKPICLKMIFGQNFNYWITNEISRSGKFAGIAFRMGTGENFSESTFSMMVPVNGTIMCRKLEPRRNKVASGAAGMTSRCGVIR